MDFVIFTFLSGGDVEMREVYTIRSTILQEYTILLLMLSFEVCISTSNNTLCQYKKYLGIIETSQTNQCRGVIMPVLRTG